MPKRITATETLKAIKAETYEERRDLLLPLIKRIIHEAGEHEREACAKVADEVAAGYTVETTLSNTDNVASRLWNQAAMARDIAAAIRARGNDDN